MATKRKTRGRAAPKRKAATGQGGPAKPDLGVIRARIDEIDASLHALINERARWIGVRPQRSGFPLGAVDPRGESRSWHQRQSRPG